MCSWSQVTWYNKQKALHADGWGGRMGQHKTVPQETAILVLCELLFKFLVPTMEPCTSRDDTKEVPTAQSYSHELWVVTKRMRLWIQAAKMSFLHRVAGP